MFTNKKECVAMLLAGGQGTRLGVLTRDVAKPAVPFGGKYRIIDFTLSNCINSGIDTIGVLTQYQPFELNQYIGNGQPWDLDRINGGVFVLPPYVRGKTGEWYKGTANAIYQNIKFVNTYDPEYVLVLSGDHIYKMDYDKMLDAHKATNADCTIAVIDVPIEEASRFGIMKTEEDSNRITEFFEKPKNPVSTKASMGIYIFNWKMLREYLIADEEDKKSDNDFGKNIIPRMLQDGKRMFAYDFVGYWKDVGTIHSLWQANMDLLDKDSGINLTDRNWKIYARNSALPPQHIGENATIGRSIISEGSDIDGEVIDSVVFQNVTVKKGAKIEHSVIMPNVTIEENAVVSYSIVAPNTVIGKDCTVGGMTECEDDVTVIGEKVILPPETVVEKGAMLEGKQI